ncbi:MAG: hypothetical protein KME45_16860 [Stenomitos rutilans HA7619-LM2]|jgi:hypothetical protein|nr:hypothetical protein [Stenomitos rutilans HA7619-LM2]
MFIPVCNGCGSGCTALGYCPPTPSIQGGLCDGVFYIVQASVTATWRSLASGATLSTRTIIFENVIRGPVSGTVALNNTSYRQVPDGFSFYGFELPTLVTQSGENPIGANNNGSNSTSNIVSITDIIGSFSATFGVRCEAQINDAFLVSVRRSDGQDDTCD